MAIARRTKEFVESVTRLVGRHVPFGEPTQNVRGRHGCHEQEGRKEEAMEDIEPSVVTLCTPEGLTQSELP